MTTNSEADRKHSSRLTKRQIVVAAVFFLLYILYKVLLVSYTAAPNATTYARPGQKIFALRMGYTIDVHDLILFQAPEGVTLAQVMNVENRPPTARLQVQRPDYTTSELDYTRIIGKVIWVTDKKNALIILSFVFLGVLLLLYIPPSTGKRSSPP